MFFAFGLARITARLRAAGQPMAKSVTWVLRTAVAVGAVIWTGGFDGVGIVAVILAAAGFAIGFYLEIRPKHEEEIHLFDDK